MRFICLGAAGIFAAAAVAVAPAFAGGNGAINQTQNVHNGPISDVIPISCSGPGLTSYAGTGNVVVHFTANSTGDWFTTTTEGQATLTTSSAPGSTYVGHVQEWFGAEDNGKTQPTNVTHATFNFTGTNVVTGASFEMHGSFDTTVNANGTTTANHFDVHCNGG